MSFIDWLLRRKKKTTEQRIATPPKQAEEPLIDALMPKVATNQATTRGAFGKSNGNRLWHEEGLRRMREAQVC